MGRVLVLDDRQIRHDSIKALHPDHEVVSAYNVSEFVEKFRETPTSLFWAIWLDHDLGEQVGNYPYQIMGQQLCGVLTGMHAVDFLCSLPEIDQPMCEIFVHSSNASANVAMHRTLRANGFRAVIHGFTEGE